MSLSPSTPLAAEWLAFAAPLTLKATLVLAAAAGAAALLRRASAAGRHLAWTLSAAALLALPLADLATPAWRVPLLPASASPPQREWPAEPAHSPKHAAAEAMHADADVTGSTEGAASAGSTGSTGSADAWAPAAATEAASASAATRFGPVDWMMWAWALGALLILGRLAFGIASLRRLAREAAEVADEEWLFLFDELSYETRLRRPVRLLRSGRATMPMTWGVLRPTILLPAEADGWDEERRRVVLLHEMAHVQRLDCLTQTLAQVACALWWFHPGAWAAAARMRAERERACDDRVLRAGARASAYAGHLIEVARRFGGPRSLAAAAVAMARPSQLEGRVLAVLDEKRERRMVSRRAAWLAAAGVALVVLPLAAMHPVARALPAELREWSRKPGQTPSAGVAAETERDADAGWEERRVVNDTANPRVAAALAERLVSDADVEVRRAAAHALAARTELGAADALVRALADRDAEVKRVALGALAERRDPRALEPLMAALRAGDDESREMAAHGLAELRDVRAADALAAALDDRSAEVRKAAVHGLGALQHRAAVPGLIEALRDDDAELRAEAAETLGELRDARAFSAVRAAARDHSAEVRRAAVQALAALGGAEAAEAVTAALSDADVEVRKAAVNALGEMELRQAPSALLEMPARERDAELCQDAIRALAEIGDKRAVPALRASLRHENAEVRKAALEGLVEIGAVVPEEVLLGLTRDADPEVRKAALHAIAEQR